MTAHLIHPREALHLGLTSVTLPACDHYAGSERFIRKALELQQQKNGAFDLTIDLEDGAPVGHEQEQLEMAVTLLHEAAHIPGRRGVRIHPIDHSFAHEEIKLCVTKAADQFSYLTLPKANSCADVARAWEQIKAATKQKTLTKLHVLIETPGALHDLWEIAAHPGVAVLDFGLMDFISAHGGAISADNMRSPGQFQHHLIVRTKSAIVEAAVAHAKVAAHNVCVDLSSPDRAAEDARIARQQFGFLRMWSIHPSQIDPIIQAMRPSEAEVGEAGEILTQAQEQQWAPISVHGRLHDRGSYRYYWSVLERAVGLGVDIDTGIKSRFFPAS